MAEGQWSNQSYNFSELKRIGYVKLKKGMQKINQMTSRKSLSNRATENHSESKKSKKTVVKSQINIFINM